MPLEATIIIVDNSEHSRNGDYIPNRFDAQSDAVSMIFNAKTSANPESSVGLMSMGGAQPEVLTTLTTDFGKVINGMARTRIRGEAHLATALNVGGLALKHRQNKSQHQRIIVFTCSPLCASEKDVIKLAKRLKKIAIAVDIVAVGAALDPDVLSKLEAFHANIKGPEDAEHQSHLVVIPPGLGLLSDAIISTPILSGEGMGMGGGGGGGGADGGDGVAGGGGGGFEYGVDPNADPELALALRMSMEEEERRTQRETREREEREGKTDLETVPEAAAEGEGSGSASGDAAKKDGDDDKKGEGDGATGGDKMDTT